MKLGTAVEWTILQPGHFWEGGFAI